jgi:hypothetical protein
VRGIEAGTGADGLVFARVYTSSPHRPSKARCAWTLRGRSSSGSYTSSTASAPPPADGDEAEVPRRERPARSCLQVSLEPNRLLFGPKLQDDHHGPWPVPDGVSARSVVVPCESIVDIARDPDVVPVRVTVAPENIDKAFAYSFHGAEQCKARTTWTPPCDSESRPDPTRVRRLCDSGFKSSGRNVRLRPEQRRGASARQPSRVRVFAVRWRERGSNPRRVVRRRGGPGEKRSSRRFGETAFACGKLA